MHANPSTPEVTRALKPCPFCNDPMEDRGYGAMHTDGARCILATYALDPVAWNTRTPARGGEELRVALERIERAYREWDRDASFPATVLAEVCGIARAALASTDMAGAGETEVEVQRILAMSDEEVLAEATADDLAWARAFKQGLRTGSKVAAPPVEGLTSGEGRARALLARVRGPSDTAEHVLAGASDEKVIGIGFAVRAIMLAASPKATATASVRECYRHVKRGTVYEVQGLAELQTADGALVDGSSLVIYKGADGKLWAREEGEFHDGRFALTDSGTADTHAGSGEVDRALRVDWNKHDLAEAYDLVEGVRRKAAQDPESSLDTSLRAALDAIEAADCEWDGLTKEPIA